MDKLLITNARLVNEGEVRDADVLIRADRIDKIATGIAADDSTEVIDARGRYLLPGMIDDQVHFREPGLTAKGDLATESAAAAAGGITSFMDMPNVNPQTTTLEALAAKYERARERCTANYGFYLGGTNKNIGEIRRLEPGHTHHVHKVWGRAPTRQIVYRCSQSLQQGAHGARARETLGQLVAHVTCSEVRKHENVRSAGHWAARRLEMWLR